MLGTHPCPPRLRIPPPPSALRKHKLFGLQSAYVSVSDGWSRAVVEKVSGDGYDVMFLDYGSRETMAAETIRPISRKLVSHPSPVLRCSLEGLLFLLSAK